MRIQLLNPDQQKKVAYLVNDEPDNVHYGEHAHGARILQEIDFRRETHRQD